MNFGFDEQQTSLGDTVAQCLSDFPQLKTPELERPQDLDVWNAMSDLGLFALLVPEDYNGVGLSLVDLALAVEALGAQLAPQIVASTLAATDAINRYGSTAQREKLLPKIATGTLPIAIAMLEADAGYDPDLLTTSLKNGSLNGKKIVVADANQASVFMTFARVEGEIGIVVVDAKAKGVGIRFHDDIDPSSGHCEVSFDNVLVGSEAILGVATLRLAALHLMNVAATIHAGMMMGIASSMLDASVEYARTRVQFGQKIGSFQAIKHRCADMAVAVEAGRSAAYYAFWAMAEASADGPRAASMAKSYCGEIARNVCNDAIQVHGGMGFTWELGLHRYLRRAKVFQQAFGDEAWHNEHIIAETLQDRKTDGRHRLDAA